MRSVQKNTQNADQKQTTNIPNINMQTSDKKHTKNTQKSNNKHIANTQHTYTNAPAAAYKLNH